MTLVASARHLLFRPKEFFERGGSRPFPALVVVGVFTVVVFVAGWSFFEILVARINGTVMVDNPAYPGDGFCEGPLDPPESIADDCDAPKEVERDIDTILNDLRGEFLALFLFFPIVAWLFNGLFLHVGSWLAGDEGTATDSFAVAAWGLVPSILSTIVGVTVLWFTFDPITVSLDSTPEELLDLVMGELGFFNTLATVLGITATLWGAYIQFGGLVTRRGVPPSRAAFIVGVLSFLAIIGQL